jgi:hypothetical protein
MDYGCSGLWVPGWSNAAKHFLSGSVGAEHPNVLFLKKNLL